MKRNTETQWIDLACRVVTFITLSYVFYYLVSPELPTFFLGPVRYEYDLGLPSPDGKYSIAVLGGDRSVIDDLSYRVYVFPREIVPRAPAKDKEIRLTGIWADPRYLVYSGYAVPALRWTSTHEIEIDLDDLYDEVDQFHPVPEMDSLMGDNSSAILVSLVLNKQDNRNVLPLP